MATSSLVLGIVALVIAIFGGNYGWVGSICGILAIIFGAIAGKSGEGKKAKAGLILGIIALCWGIIVTVACFACFGAVLGGTYGLLQFI